MTSRDKSRWARFSDSDFFFSFKRSPVAIMSFMVVCILVLSAIFAPLVAPTNPFDPASLEPDERLHATNGTQCVYTSQLSDGHRRSGT